MSLEAENTQRKRALTSRQERKLVDYLDEQFMQLTRNFRKRSEVSSTLKTLPTYLAKARQILALILQIPPIDPSTSLRVAYLLHLTGDTLSSIPGYRIGSTTHEIRATLQDLVDFLDDLDQAWIAVLRGQVWDPEAGDGVDLVLSDDIDVEMSNGLNTNGNQAPRKSSPPSQTDLARLRSLLFSGESSLEEWLTNERAQIADKDQTGDELGDVSGMLDRMGLLGDFDALFVRTLNVLGGFGGDISQNIVNPELESRME